MPKYAERTTGFSHFYYNKLYVNSFFKNSGHNIESLRQRRVDKFIGTWA